MEEKTSRLRRQWEETQAPEALPAPVLPVHRGAFTTGEVLLGRFRIVRLIGRGGMGEVYEAEDLELGRIALKTIRLLQGDSQKMLHNFRQEVLLARKISGPHVCRIHELFTLPPAGPHAPAAFLTMEYLEGETLAERLRQGPLPMPLAQKLALQLCAGLACIHNAGVLHRDLKARNVMLTSRHGEQAAVLMDFGLALPLENASGAGVTGTLECMAPEQFVDAQLTPATDIYALGTLLYAMVTGHAPFPAQSAMESAIRRGHRPALEKTPRGWREIIFRCLEYEPHDRYPSANAVAAALHHAANPVDYAAHATASWMRRFRIGMGVAIAVCAAVLIAYYTRRPSAHHPPQEALRWYAKGEEALREATYVKAINALQSAVARDPKYCMAHARLAEAWNALDFNGAAEREMVAAGALAQRQRLTESENRLLAATQAGLMQDHGNAITLLRKAVEEAGSDEKPGVLVDLGRAEEAADQPLAAKTEYEHAAKLAPDTPAPWMHIGILESHMEHRKQAIEAFARAEKIYQTEQNMEGVAEVEYQRGYLENESGDPKAGRVYLQASLEDARKLESVQLQIRALTQLSSVSVDQGLLTEAIAEAQQAIQLAHDNGLLPWAAEAMVRQVDAQRYLPDQSKEMQSAEEATLQQALQTAQASQQPRQQARANLALASLLQSEGARPDEAVAYAQRALDYYRPNHFHEPAFSAELLLARTEREQDRLPQALRDARDMLQDAQQSSNPREITMAQQLLGSILLRQQDYPAALAAFESGLSGGVSSLRPYLLLDAATALAGLGRYDEAEKKLAERPAKDEEGLLVEARMLESRGKFTAAAQLFAANVPLQTSAGIERAQALTAAGKLDDAARALEQVKAGTPRDAAEAALAMAGLQLARKRPAQAAPLAAQAIDYFARLGERDSLLHAYDVARSAARQSGDTARAAQILQQELDILAQLRQSWAAADYQSFASRPDIAAIAAARP